jgi:DNA polymerase III subunit gamma/tau
VFENILDHNEIVSVLKEDIKTNKLPSSLLFYGDVYTGKLTAALELARVLSCLSDGLWSCKCSSCAKHRLMDAPGTVMLGNRYFIEEIEACADVLKRNRQPTGQYQFLRAVRKLTRRFDQQIWEGQENKLKGLNTELEKIELILEKIQPGTELPEEKKLDKLLTDSGKICNKIITYISGDNIPIHQIRNITYWSHTTFTGLAKIIILEGADSMGEASRNALLKIIEEPPPSVYFILISSRKNKIIPTILSRVRPYNFRSRTDIEDKNILRRIFKDDSNEYTNLRDYFMAMKGINLSILRQYANKSFDILLNKKELDIEDFSELIEIIKENHVLKVFLEEMLFLLHKKIPVYSNPENNISLHILDRWNVLIHKSISNRMTFNQNTKLLFETLLYQMRDVI